MLYGEGALFIVELGLLIYCVLDIVTTPPEAVRNLPKLVWLVLVVIFPLVGGIAWLVAGRAVGSATASMPYKGNRGIPPEYDRPGRAAAASPDDDESFLRGLRERAEQQRRAAEQQRKASEDG